MAEKRTAPNLAGMGAAITTNFLSERLYHAESGKTTSYRHGVPSAAAIVSVH